MRVEIEKGRARGSVRVPSSKSLVHRFLLGAALADGTSCLACADLNEDILATIDCIKSIGADISMKNNAIVVKGCGTHVLSEKKELRRFFCRESGSTLRFTIPIALLGGGGIFGGSERLISRGIGVYEKLFSDEVEIQKRKTEISLRGRLSAGEYRLPGDVSSQFITGLLFSLPMLRETSSIEVVSPFESRGYVDLTLDVLRCFGVKVLVRGENVFSIPGGQSFLPVEIEIEGDWSQAAFFCGLNFLGGNVDVRGLSQNSLQGDRVCVELFEKMSRGYVREDLSGCPDLAPILFAMASVGYGASFTGTRRLAIKESNRALVMAKELSKFGAKITVHENDVVIEPSELHKPSEVLLGHNDHRIVMALSVLATRFGGMIEGADAIGKSYPSFFEDMRCLGLEVREYDT